MYFSLRESIADIPLRQKKHKIDTQMRVKSITAALMATSVLLSCSNPATKESTAVTPHDWSRQSVIYEVNIRQYTPEGTLAAFTEHLPRLKDLGVDILWLMPIYPISELNHKGSLGSYYAVADYQEVNPAFGTKDDVRKLIGEAHNLGMKVVLDWVANHTGCDHRWTTEHPEWYVHNSENDGFYSPYDWTDTYELDYDKPEMRRAMVNAMQYWIREFDIDGFRCDVAYEVPTEFWNEIRPQLDSVKPMFMLAEAELPELLEHGFDMAYNWPLKNLLFDIAQGRRTAQSIDTLLVNQEQQFPQRGVLINHLTNHDLNSWDGSEFERFGDAVKAFATLVYTIPGMPLIYTAQEIGLDRRIEFFEKDPVTQWQRNEWFDFYKSLNELKHNNIALDTYGKWSQVQHLSTNSDDVIAYRRTKGDNNVLVVLNLSPRDAEQNINLADIDLADYRNAADGEAAALPATLPAWSHYVFIKD